MLVSRAISLKKSAVFLYFDEKACNSSTSSMRCLALSKVSSAKSS